jgi:hypothetical protein
MMRFVETPVEGRPSAAKRSSAALTAGIASTSAVRTISSP